MRPSRLLLTALLAVATSGCVDDNRPPPGLDTGSVQFDYVLLEPDPRTGLPVANDCATLGVSELRFSVGDDLNNNGVLDDAEVVEFADAPCNQLGDVNGDGAVDRTEIGQFVGLDFTADTYSSFSVEVLSERGNPIPWQTFDSQPGQTLTFPGGLSIDPGVINIIPFEGADQIGEELQIFIDF
jgi:hypothetical protein